jgi:hypothetical protein
MAINERRICAPRVQFDRSLEAKLMAIDGTWCRECLLINVSGTGARIELTGPAAKLEEFFLMLSSFGKPVFRRCKMEWVDGTNIGVSFLMNSIEKKPLKVSRRESKLV